MAKLKRKPPASIRLSPEAEGFVVDLQKATGWSLSKVVEHMVMLGMRVQREDQNGVKLIRAHIRTSMESHTQIVKAEAIASAARSEIRKTAAAVKGSK
jgi:hypothetical protein